MTQFLKIFFKTVFLVSVGILVPFGTYFLLTMFMGAKAEKTVVAETKQSSSSKSVFTSLLEPIYGKPARVYSDTRAFDVNLIEVGVEPDGSLETPKDWKQGGWYKKSSLAGKIGNIIINAHYDDNYGRPAGFWGLKNIETNDKVYLVDEYGKTHSYTVFNVSHINISDPNRLDVFSDTPDESTLTLITCGGVWLPKFGTYNERLVVKARLVQN